MRVGRYGPYIEEVVPAGIDPDRRGHGRGGDSPRPVATATDDVAPDELTVGKARELLAKAADDGRVLGTDPATGTTIVAKAGRYGPYVTEVLPEADEAPTQGQGRRRRRSPARRRLFKDMDLETVELDGRAAAALAAAGRRGRPPSGEEITAQNGRYGPYLKKGTDSRSLETEEQLFDITLDRRSRSTPSPAARPRPPPSRRWRSWAPTRCRGSPWWSRTGGSAPTSPTARPTRRCARTTTPRRSRPSAARAAGRQARQGSGEEGATKAPAKKATTTTATRKTAAKKTTAKKTTATRTTTPPKKMTPSTSATPAAARATKKA